jgi:acid stress-induced BolA-like protein IbaG/YrbA
MKIKIEKPNMRIKISPSSVFSGSWNVLTNSNTSEQKTLISTIFEGLSNVKNHFSIRVPGKKWILVSCIHDTSVTELKVYKTLTVQAEQIITISN